MIRIQTEDFSVEAETRDLIKDKTVVGGVVSFVGTVRDYAGDDAVTAMELEHYPGMTEKELEKIETAARARFGVEEVLVVHRVGRLAVQDNIVLVVAAARHRADAFDACRFMIDHLKVKATFWKKEITPNGEKWVDSCPGCEAAASQWTDLKAPAHTHPVEEKPPHPPALPHGHDHPKSAHHDHHAHAKKINWSGLRVGILTLSDSRDLARDKSGDALEGLVLAAGGEVAKREIMPDDEARISGLLVEWSDQGGLDVILTTGGTGPGPRDVTPEATRAVTEKELPGLSEEIRKRGLEQVRSALFTRGVAALRGHTLIVNLPGSTRGAAHSFEAVADVVPHALKMVHGGGH